MTANRVVGIPTKQHERACSKCHIGRGVVRFNDWEPEAQQTCHDRLYRPFRQTLTNEAWSKTE